VSDAQIQCWCPSCGMMRTDYVPLPFCRHNVEATSPHASVRMVAMPSWHPLAASHPDAPKYSEGEVGDYNHAASSVPTREGQQ